MFSQIIIRIVIIIGVLISGYYYLCYEINSRADKKYSEAISNLEREQLLALDNLQKKQNNIVSGYLSKISAMQKQHEEDLKEIRNAKYRDSLNNATIDKWLYSSDKTGVSQSKDRPDIVCYPRAALQEKIQRTLDIARECDEIALKYKALYDTCNGGEHDK